MACTSGGCALVAVGTLRPPQTVCRMSRCFAQRAWRFPTALSCAAVSVLCACQGRLFYKLPLPPQLLQVLRRITPNLCHSVACVPIIVLVVALLARFHWHRLCSYHRPPIELLAPTRAVSRPTSSRLLRAGGQRAAISRPARVERGTGGQRGLAMAAAEASDMAAGTRRGRI